MRPYRFLVSVSLAALMTACAVGPDFERPAKPQTPSYESSALPAQTDATKGHGGDAQKFVSGQDVPAAWWEMFHSEPLNRMIEQALKSNPDLAAAEAALRAAGESTAAADATLFPTLSGDVGTSRQKLAGAGFGGSFPGTIFTLHNASVSVAYGLDVFGGTRRQIEEIAAAEEYQKFQMEAARLTIAANVVTATIQEASLRGQIDATQKIINEETRQRDILKRQLDVGAISREAVLAQDAILAQVKATLPPLEKSLAQIRHQLSVLEGQFPSDAPKDTFELANLTLPAALPVTVPSQLVEQRPDVRAAEANLHAASAAIGVAIANRLPQITLSADIGDEANSFAKMFTPGTGFWSMGVDAAGTIFDFGRLEHEEGAAKADYDVAAAQYRKTVLTAFQDVADTLHALQSDASTLKAQVAAQQAAQSSLALSRTQFQAGAINYITLLDAERVDQQAQVSVVQAEAQRFADTAALFQALGGGWWNRAPAPAAAAETKPAATTEAASNNAPGSSDFPQPQR